MKPIVINIHNLVENLSVTDSVQGRQELEDSLTETFNKVIHNAQSQVTPENCKKGKASATEKAYNKLQKDFMQATSHHNRESLSDKELEKLLKVLCKKIKKTREPLERARRNHVKTRQQLFYENQFDRERLLVDTLERMLLKLAESHRNLWDF